MKPTVILVGLFSFCLSATDVEQINLLNGNWQCQMDVNVEGINIKGSSLNYYNSTEMTYQSTSEIAFIYQGMHVARFNSSENGRWSYKNSEIIYRTDNISFDDAFDCNNILTKGFLKQLKQDAKSDILAATTIKLDTTTWITLDKVTGNRSQCVKH